MPSRISAVCLMLLITLLSCCSSESNYIVQKPSLEKPVNIIGISPAFFTKGDIRSALQLTYETELPFDNIKGLREEAEKIWSSFKSEVESGGYNAAVIMAQSPPVQKGLFTKEGQASGFLIVKEADGKWVFYMDKQK